VHFDAIVAVRNWGGLDTRPQHQQPNRVNPDKASEILSYQFLFYKIEIRSEGY
jgi:hypothetical protein